MFPFRKNIVHNVAIFRGHRMPMLRLLNSITVNASMQALQNITPHNAASQASLRSRPKPAGLMPPTINFERSRHATHRPSHFLRPTHDNPTPRSQARSHTRTVEQFLPGAPRKEVGEVTGIKPLCLSCVQTRLALCCCVCVSRRGWMWGRTACGRSAHSRRR